jgi:hypothetical protein
MQRDVQQFAPQQVHGHEKVLGRQEPGGCVHVPMHRPSAGMHEAAGQFIVSIGRQLLFASEIDLACVRACCLGTC